MLLALSAGTAFGHVERSSYWPDPAPDPSVEPAAGGKVPKARSLASALRGASRGDTQATGRALRVPHIQAAVNDATNNDRVVVMPGE